MAGKVDLYLDGRTKIQSYRAMLEILRETGLPAITHLEAYRKRSSDGRYLCIRHDADHSLEMAVQMARIEHDLGIEASYYLLPPGDYDKDENYYGNLRSGAVRHAARLKEAALEIVSLGHEIGLHNDFVQLSTKVNRPVVDLIAAELDYFRGIGVDIN